MCSYKPNSRTNDNLMNGVLPLYVFQMQIISQMIISRWNKRFWGVAAVQSSDCLVVRLPDWMTHCSLVPWPPATQAICKHSAGLRVRHSRSHESRQSWSYFQRVSRKAHADVWNQLESDSAFAYRHRYMRITHTKHPYAIQSRGWQVARQTFSYCDWCSLAFNPH